jgi:hypothetical protein
VLFALIYSYVQFKPLALGVTTLGVITGVAGLLAYQRYGKPCPKEFKGLKNLGLDRLASSHIYLSSSPRFKKNRWSFQ